MGYKGRMPSNVVRQWTRSQTISYQREVAHQAARSELRKNDVNPSSCTVDEAWAVLNELMITDPNALASVWIRNTGIPDGHHSIPAGYENQEKLFGIEWRRWCRKQNQTK